MASPEQPFSEQQELFVPNLLTNYEETIRRMAEVEGEGWLKEERAVEQKEVHPDVYESKYHNSAIGGRDAAERGKSSVIYGWGGVHRWFVKEDGTVGFSIRHAEDDDTPRRRQVIEKVESLGFKAE